MTGEYQHNLDSKGRLFIPVKMREELGETFFITLSPERCLSVYSEDAWSAFVSRVNALPYTKQQRMRALFVYAVKCELDGQGRVLIPMNLRQYANLVKGVAVIGCNSHAELWDSETWNSISAIESSPENIASVMEELQF